MVATENLEEDTLTPKTAMEATHMVLPLESIQVAFLNNLVTLDTITVLNIKVHSFMALAISILLVPLSIPLGEPPIQKVAKT